MITNKDREDAVSMTRIWIRDSEGNQLEELAGIISRIRSKLADQARKEAAERVSRAWREHGEDITLRTIRTAILDDSTTDRIHDSGEKLAIAAKALEKINERHSFADIVDDSYIISHDALKEIQK